MFLSSRLNRMAKLLPSALVATGLSLMAGSASASGELHVYNWGDYINPAVLDKFSQEYDVKVTLDTYGSNEEMLAKIQAGATGYDIVFPSVHMHDIMQKLGLLERTDINKSPGFENIDPQFLRSKMDPKGEFCLPYAWGSVGILYNKEEIGGDISGWKDFFALPDRGLKIAMLDDMRETIGVGLIVNGKSVNSGSKEDLKMSEKYLLDRKSKVSAFTYDSVPMVQSGDVAAAHYYVGGMYYVLEEPEKLGLLSPRKARPCIRKTSVSWKQHLTKATPRNSWSFICSLKSLL